MKRVLVIMLAAGALFLAGCAGQSGSSSGGGDGISTGEARMGTVLTTAKGKTLYYFDKSSPYAEDCKKRCKKSFKAYKMNGEHVSHKGNALYTYKKDKKAGQAKGEGYNRVWRVAKP